MKKTLTKSTTPKVKNEELNELFSELKTEYLETFPEKIVAIEKLWQAKNKRALEDEYHKMKGTGTTYGVEEVSRIAELMEDMCYQGHPQLGFGVLMSIELFQRVREHSISNTTYELDKDNVFKALRKLHDKLESA
jgi:chemotaxis protein histidine kinase CheA